MIPVNADAGAEIGLASWLLEELSVPADNGTRLIVAECIRIEAKTRGAQKAAAYILAQAMLDKSAGTRINRFWFTDQKYNDGIPVPAPAPPESVRESAERRAYEMWKSMSDEYKERSPWTGRVWA